MVKIKSIRYLIIKDKYYRIGDNIFSLYYKENEKTTCINEGVIYSITDETVTIWDELLQKKIQIPVYNILEQ